MSIIRKTKIIVTIGESSCSKPVLIDLIRAGMDIARISDRFLKIDKQEVLKNLKEAIEETQTPIGIMLSLRESDIRIGTYTKEPLILKKNDIVYISQNPEKSNGSTLWCNNKEFSSLIQPGDKLLVDFGKIILTVLDQRPAISRSESDLTFFQSSPEIDGSKIGNIIYMLNSKLNLNHSYTRNKANSGEFKFNRFKRAPKSKKNSREVVCCVENDCVISAHKPVHISSPGQSESKTSYATISEDFKLIEWANSNDIDFVVIRQVRNTEDLEFLLNLISSSSKKILGVQNKNNVDGFEELVSNIDGVMIGRGTLALETSLADVCRIQKKVVKRCNELAKPVIISTQLLENMVLYDSPTRSEVTDVTNAVLDGADALMLTAETALGNYPVRALRACSRICVEAEQYLNYSEQCEKIKKILGKNITITENTCYSAVVTVLSTGAKVIVCLTESGRTAQIISRFMPPCAIVALTNSKKTEKIMKIIRGVFPYYVTEEKEEDLLCKISSLVKEKGFAQSNDLIVVVGGSFYNFAAGNTCSLQILTVK